MTQIGLMLEGQFGLTWARWQRILDAAEQLNFQNVFRSDHYTIGPPDLESLETFISLTYAADHTSRIEFGPLVAPTTFRHPALTLRMAAQIDDLSGGRMVLGLGNGWHEREHRQFGIPFYDVPTRYAMFQDALEITTRLLDSAEPVSYAGKHFSLDGAVLLPRPRRRMPVLIGGNGMNRTLPLVAQYADEWNGVFINPQGYRERTARLNDLLTTRGRPTTAVKRSLMTEVIIARDEAALAAKLRDKQDVPADLATWDRIAGTPQQVVDHIGRYVDAGCERFMLQWLDLDDLDGIAYLAQTVLPHFHS